MSTTFCYSRRKSTGEAAYRHAQNSYPGSVPEGAPQYATCFATCRFQPIFRDLSLSTCRLLVYSPVCVPATRIGSDYKKYREYREKTESLAAQLQGIDGNKQA